MSVRKKSPDRLTYQNNDKKYKDNKKNSRDQSKDYRADPKYQRPHKSNYKKDTKGHDDSNETYDKILYCFHGTPKRFWEVSPLARDL